MVDRNESILNSIKHSLGSEPNESHFDSQITMHINSAFSKLFQFGVGTEPFRVQHSTDTWGEVPADDKYIDLVKEFVYLDVWRVFDPPTSGFVLEDIKQQLSELEWRIREACDLLKRNPHPEVN